MACRKIAEKCLGKLKFNKYNKYVTLHQYSTNGLIQISNENGVKRITMVDKETRNSLSLQMTECLLNTITSETDDPNLRCIVISAVGDVFSAGHNLKQLISEEGEEVFPKFAKLMMSIVKCPVPVISLVDGLATAAGCQIVAQSDIAICSERSYFSTPGANFGIFCSTPGIPLARCVPRKLSAYMLFSGLPITSGEALQFGLVTKVTSSEDLECELEKIIESIKMKSRAVVEMGKKFYYEQMDMPLEAAYRQGTKVMMANLKMQDGQEGLKSFKEKRKPNWKHRI